MDTESSSQSSTWDPAPPIRLEVSEELVDRLVQRQDTLLMEHLDIFSHSQQEVLTGKLQDFQNSFQQSQKEWLTEQLNAFCSTFIQDI